MDGNSDSVVRSGPDIVVGVVSSCSSTRQCSGRHNGQHASTSSGHVASEHVFRLNGGGHKHTGSRPWASEPCMP